MLDNLCLFGGGEVGGLDLGGDFGTGEYDTLDAIAFSGEAQMCTPFRTVTVACLQGFFCRGFSNLYRGNGRNKPCATACDVYKICTASPTVKTLLRSVLPGRIVK